MITMDTLSRHPTGSGLLKHFCLVSAKPSKAYKAINLSKLSKTNNAFKSCVYIRFDLILSKAFRVGAVLQCIASLVSIAF